MLQNAPFRGSKTQLLPAAKPAFSVLKRGVFRGLKQRFLPSEMRFSAPIRQPENAFERVLFGVQCFVRGFCKKVTKTQNAAQIKKMQNGANMGVAVVQYAKNTDICAKHCGLSAQKLQIYYSFGGSKLIL